MRGKMFDFKQRSVHSSQLRDSIMTPKWRTLPEQINLIDKSWVVGNGITPRFKSCFQSKCMKIRACSNLFNRTRKGWFPTLSSLDAFHWILKGHDAERMILLLFYCILPVRVSSTPLYEQLKTTLYWMHQLGKRPANDNNRGERGCPVFTCHIWILAKLFKMRQRAGGKWSTATKTIEYIAVRCEA